MTYSSEQNVWFFCKSPFIWSEEHFSEKITLVTVRSLSACATLQKGHSEQARLTRFGAESGNGISGPPRPIVWGTKELEYLSDY